MCGFGIFNTYIVTIECKGSSYISTDWEGDSKFEDYSFTDQHIMQGGELMELFAKELNNTNIFEFGLKDGKWCFSFFQPLNGSSCDKRYTIKEKADE